MADNQIVQRILRWIGTGSVGTAILLWVYECVVHLPFLYTEHGWQLLLWAKYHVSLSSSLYTELSTRALDHMYAVRGVLHSVDVVWLFVSLIVIGFCCTGHEWQNCVRKGSILAGTFVMLITITGLFQFQTLFELFHQLVFPQGNYTFPVSSTLKQAFPDQFFQTMAVIIGAMTLILSILINLCWWHRYD